MKNRLLLSIFLLSLPIFANAQTQANTSDRDSETVVLSDTLSYDDVTKTSIFKGNVILTRGSMRLTADKLQAREDSKGFQYGEATAQENKKVTLLEERLQNYETIYAEGNTANYNSETGIIRLVGQSLLVHRICGKVMNTLRGNVITYNSKHNTYYAEGSSSTSQGRVRSVVQARSKSKQAVAECRQQYHGKPMPSSIQKK